MIEPLVSVLIAVRNGETYLADALDSVAAQHVEHLEVIVVDDGSTDDSTGVASRHAMQPRVVRQGQLGYPAALNEGIRHCTGQYVALLDCDDAWPVGRLRNLLDPFEENRDLDLVFGRMVNTDSALRPNGQASLVRMLTAGLLLRSSFAAVGEFRTDVAHGAVVDWISRAESVGTKFGTTDGLVLLRRIHGDNMGIRDREAARVDMLKIMRDHRARQKG